MTNLGVRNSDFADSWYAEHGEALNAGWDALKRDQELDAEGISGEIIFPDADAVESPYLRAIRHRAWPFRGRRPGARHGGRPGAQPLARRALCPARPERRCGAALIPITAELDDVLAEIRRSKESGLGAMMIPAMWMHGRPYHDRHYDPVWALCEELQMPVMTHSGPSIASSTATISASTSPR